MPLDLTDCQFSGPALPEPFVKFELEKELNKRKLLTKTTGSDGKQLKRDWDVYRRVLRSLAASGGALRVRNHVIEPLKSLLGYEHIESAPDVQTREERESGGSLLITADGQAHLRVWTTSYDEDLFAPSKRGRAYRFSHLRIAQRVLLATGERAGLLTNGVDLMLLISDPARPDSTVTIPLDAGWKRSRDVPDSFRFLLAMASPAGLQAIPELVDKARLGQTRVTKELRKQARRAVRRFIQEILDHPDNRDWLQQQTDREQLARNLWREGLITVYRLLFLLKLETSDDVARSFTFASTSLWRNTFSPSMALAGYAHDVLERGVETGHLLESGLKSLFRMFEQGLECTELVVKPLGGALFGPDVTPTLSQLAWGERAVAHLLDQLLWTTPQSKSGQRERVHYGPLDVEDLGRVYEALLELEPGIALAPMCRLKRQKLEVVVPAAQGERYRPAQTTDIDPDEETDDDEQTTASTGGKKTAVEWVEEIRPGQFYLRVGLGRKASGSYYTPHSFVRFLVQETLGPQVAQCSPEDDPNPLAILQLRVLDPAMGSGHFLVEACRFLGEKLYEACRLSDEKALAAERRAEKVKKSEAEALLEEARAWRQRVIDLPDPDDELLKYLPSRSPEGEESGLSQQQAIALCRRLVATHCLYGVDKNPLAVELAKLALWLESHAAGMPLTFLDHRLVLGDSLTGPFWEHLLTWPSRPKEPFEGTVFRGIEVCFKEAMFSALRHIRRLEAGVGATVAEIAEKDAAKRDLDEALLPIRVVAAAWSGGVMLGPQGCDDAAYLSLLQHVAVHHELPEQIGSESLRRMIARGLGAEEVPADRESIHALVKSGRCVPALPYDLTFPEVFYPNAVPHGRQGFHVVLGNPPWDTVTSKEKEWFAAYDIRVLDARSKREREEYQKQILQDVVRQRDFEEYLLTFESLKRTFDILYKYQKVIIDGDLAGRFLDLFRVFMERNTQLLRTAAYTGIVCPGAFHANVGGAGVRGLYLNLLNLKCCYSFENRRKLFEIDSRFKFATVVAQAGKPTERFDCAFYLHDDQWLFASSNEKRALVYTREFIKKTGGEYFTFLELRDEEAVDVAKHLYSTDGTTKAAFALLSIDFATNPVALNLTKDADIIYPVREVSIERGDTRTGAAHAALWDSGYMPLWEGKHAHQFTDTWESAPEFCVPVHIVAGRSHLSNYARYFHIVCREVTCSTNERTVIASVLPPGGVTAYTLVTERQPARRPNSVALCVIAYFNSYVFDFAARLQVQTHLNLTILRHLPWWRPSRLTITFVAHEALRLTCNHAGYEPLWREQLGDVWREPGKRPFSWPILESDDERWAVRAAIDAVVADAYGLSREQYEHVLSTFSHASYPAAPELCLARFDELQQIGLDAFTKKYDPYHDMPLNENLPKPVIDLPLSGEEQTDGEFRLKSAPLTNSRRKRKSPQN